MIRAAIGRVGIPSVLGAGLLALAVGLTGCAGGSGSGTGSDTQPGASTVTLLPPTAVNVAAPVITSVTPTQAFPGDLVTITGSGFGSNQLATSHVLFTSDGVNLNIDAGAVATTANWSNSTIQIKIPSNAVSGPVQVVIGKNTRNQLNSNQGTITVKRAFDPNASPKVVFINPARGQFAGIDTPVIVVFDRPILLSSITSNVTAVSLEGVAVPDPSLKQKDPPKDPCSFPFVCDLRATDLINCTCINRVTVTGIADISAELRTTPQTAFRIEHTATNNVTIVVNVNSSIRSDGSLDQNGQPRSVAGPNIPSLGEVFFYFQD